MSDGTWELLLYNFKPIAKICKKIHEIDVAQGKYKLCPSDLFRLVSYPTTMIFLASTSLSEMRWLDGQVY